MKIKVSMKWCEERQQWFMYQKGYFVMNFPDCKNIHKFFERGLSKNKDQQFLINIGKI